MSSLRDLVRRLGHKPWFAALGSRVAPRVDRLVDALTGGRYQAARLFIPTLMLTTRGRKTGRPRTVPLLYVRHDDAFAVTGSNWGGESHPAWSENLLADPEAVLTVEGETVRVRARLVEGEERERLWEAFCAEWPAYETYRERAGGRQIRVFALDPSGRDHEGP